MPDVVRPLRLGACRTLAPRRRVRELGNLEQLCNWGFGFFCASRATMRAWTLRQLPHAPGRRLAGRAYARQGRMEGRRRSLWQDLRQPQRLEFFHVCPAPPARRRGSPAQPEGRPPAGRSRPAGRLDAARTAASIPHCGAGLSRRLPRPCQDHRMRLPPCRMRRAPRRRRTALRSCILRQCGCLLHYGAPCPEPRAAPGFFRAPARAPHGCGPPRRTDAQDCRN